MDRAVAEGISKESQEPTVRAARCRQKSNPTRCGLLEKLLIFAFLVLATAQHATGQQSTHDDSQRAESAGSLRFGGPDSVGDVIADDRAPSEPVIRLPALEQARKELDAALAQARQKRPDKADENLPGGKGGPLAGLKDQLAGLGDLLAAKASVIGTFNVSSTLGLQAGGAQDRIASATERTAKGVEDLRKDVRNHSLVFAS